MKDWKAQISLHGVFPHSRWGEQSIGKGLEARVVSDLGCLGRGWRGGDISEERSTQAASHMLSSFANWDFEWPLVLIPIADLVKGEVKSGPKALCATHYSIISGAKLHLGVEGSGQLYELCNSL